VPVIIDESDMYIAHYESLFCEEIEVKRQFKFQTSLKAGELLTLATG